MSDSRALLLIKSIPKLMIWILKNPMIIPKVRLLLHYWHPKSAIQYFSPGSLSYKKEPKSPEPWLIFSHYTVITIFKIICFWLFGYNLKRFFLCACREVLLIKLAPSLIIRNAIDSLVHARFYMIIFFVNLL